MANAQPNFGDLTVDPPGMAKKKKAKAPRKPRAECTPEEIAKLDAELAKRRNWRAVVKDNAAARKFVAERDVMEAARPKAEVEEKEAIVNKAKEVALAIMRADLTNASEKTRSWFEASQKEMALAIMSADLTNVSEKTRSWFKARQKEMFDADDLNKVVRCAVAVLFWRLVVLPVAGFVAGEDV